MFTASTGSTNSAPASADLSHTQNPLSDGEDGDVVVFAGGGTGTGHGSHHPQQPQQRSREHLEAVAGDGDKEEDLRARHHYHHHHHHSKSDVGEMGRWNPRAVKRESKPQAGNNPINSDSSNSVPDATGGKKKSSTARVTIGGVAEAPAHHNSSNDDDDDDPPRPLGRLQVRVTRDGHTTLEDVDPQQLAHLYAQQQAALRKMQSQFDFLTVPDWVRLHPMVGPYLAEFTGSFAWVLTLSLTSIRNTSIFNTADDTNVTFLPIGLMITTMIFTFGYISGGHYNPAISLAVFLINRMDLVRCLAYIVCQVTAAFCAGLVAIFIQADSNIFVPSVENSFVSSGIFSELIYTFAIALVVLNTGYSRQSGNFFYGFAIGMTMAAGSASVGHISGGAFNPAAATGLQLAKCLSGSCEDLKSFWVYWLSPLVGAVAAALIFSQMYQPTTTQVLEDHKVLVDAGKAYLRGQRGGQPSDNDEENEDDGASHSGDDSVSNRDDDSSSSDSATPARARNNAHGDDADEVEMTSRGGNPDRVVLNDSLTDRTVR